MGARVCKNDLLPEVACVYLEARPVLRGSERCLRLGLLFNKEPYTGHPKWPSSFPSPFWHVGVWRWGGVYLGALLQPASEPTHGISTGPHFSIS